MWQNMDCISICSSGYHALVLSRPWYWKSRAPLNWCLVTRVLDILNLPSFSFLLYGDACAKQNPYETVQSMFFYISMFLVYCACCINCFSFSVKVHKSDVVCVCDVQVFIHPVFSLFQMNVVVHSFLHALALSLLHFQEVILFSLNTSVCVLLGTVLTEIV